MMARPFDVRRFPGFASASWAVLAFLYLPLVSVVAYSFNNNRLVTQWTGFSGKWYSQVANRQEIRDAMSLSLRLAVTATVLATALALGGALGLSAMSRRNNGWALALIGAPLVIPEVVSAVATLAFFVLIGLPLGFTALLIAHTAFCIPFALLPIRARLGEIDHRMFEAAVDLGASRWKTLQRVTLPLLGPGILSGALLSFIISLDDYLISAFLGGPSTTTLPVFIFGMIRNGITPAVNALSTLLLVLSIIITSISYYFGQKRRLS